jgi:hypothetical protein
LGCLAGVEVWVIRSGYFTPLDMKGDSRFLKETVTLGCRP